ncbi:MAG: hypothetical protein ACRDZO_28490 [Egibacteraceae bacterium]
MAGGARLGALHHLDQPARHRAATAPDKVDASVMAVAESRGEPVFTFDFRGFRAVKGPDQGTWPLVVNEADLAR